MVNAKADTIKWPEDSTRINVREDADVEFWARRFHVSTGKLKHAVRAVGPKFKDVSHHLSYRRG